MSDLPGRRTVNETVCITLTVTADPRLFEGGDGKPSTPLTTRVTDELVACLESCHITAVDVITARLESPPKDAS